MTTSKNLLTQPLRQVPNSLVVIVLLVALLGFADATYLTIEHYKNVIPPCSVTSGCETVLTSAYSVVLGIPVSLLGSLFYLAILVGTFAYLEGKREKIFRYSLWLTPLGFLATLYFLILQAFVIHSFCQYCLGSAITSTLLFILAIIIFKKYRSDEPTLNSNNQIIF